MRPDPNKFNNNSCLQGAQQWGKGVIQHEKPLEKFNVRGANYEPSLGG